MLRDKSSHSTLLGPAVFVGIWKSSVKGPLLINRFTSGLTENMCMVLVVTEEVFPFGRECKLSIPGGQK